MPMYLRKRWADAWRVAIQMMSLVLVTSGVPALANAAPQATAAPQAPAVQQAGAQTATAPAHGVPIPLWPGGAPLAQGTEAIDIPTLTPYLPATPTPTGTAVIVCPGGSYMRLSMQKEGSDVAAWFNQLGITAFVLTYRLGPKYHHPVELMDAQRAIRYVRSLAPALNLRTDRIGILGFSAGGHLASTTATHFDEPKADAPDPIDRENARPDFAMLIYPVITMTESWLHKVSRGNLLGDSPDPALLELLSNERQVTARTPPTFLFHTDDDPGVPAANSAAFYLAMKRAGVPGELHIYQHGKHGVGLGKDDPVLSTWPDRLADWLRVRGLIPGYQDPAAATPAAAAPPR
jgi:acetyl esterase/lipase